MPTSRVVILVSGFLVFLGAGLAAPAQAEVISVSCTWAPGRDLLVNIDLASASVTAGYAVDGGTRYGPYAAQISALVIAWDEGNFHVTLSRVTGDLHYHGRAGSDWHDSCRSIPPPQPVIR